MSDNFLSGVEQKYPAQLLDIRLSVEGNVISCLFKDMLLLDENVFNKNMFITRDGFFYYQMLAALRDKGFYSLDEVTIMSNFGDDFMKKFDDLGGFESVQHMADIISIENFDVYYDDLVRENMLIKMWADHINLLESIDVMGKQTQMLKYFRKLTSEQLEEFWEVRVGDYGYAHSNKVLEEEMIDFDESFIDDCTLGIENGIPFDVCGIDINDEPIPGFKMLSKQMLGFLPGTLSMIGAHSGTGKSSFWITIVMAMIYRGEKILIISNEETAVKFKTKFLVWILYNYCRYYKLTKAKLTSGNITDEDREHIKIAQDFWDSKCKNKLKFIAIEDADISTVKKKVRENVLKYGFTTCIYDTLKIEESDMTNTRTDLALVRDSRELHRLAKKYNIIMLSSVQLAENSRGTLALTANTLSNCKQLIEILENLILMRNVYGEELDESNRKHYCEPFRRTKVDEKWVKEAYEVDPDGVYRMIFVEKTRNGKNSNDTGCCFLYKFIGDYTSFKELCQCKIKHGIIQ